MHVSGAKHSTYTFPPRPNKSPLRLVGLLSPYSTEEKVQAASRVKEHSPGLQPTKGTEPEEASACSHGASYLHLEGQGQPHPRAPGLASGGSSWFYSCLSKPLMQNTKCRPMQALGEPEFKPWPLRFQRHHAAQLTGACKDEN